MTREWCGQGIGRQLIGTFEAYGRAQGFTTGILEVIDTNLRAQQLYSRHRREGSIGLWRRTSER